MLLSARSGNWLFNRDWMGVTVILTEAEHKRAYPFRNIQTALKPSTHSRTMGVF